MSNYLIKSLFVILVLSLDAQNLKPQKPQISEAFQGQVMKLIEDGSKISAVTSEGVNILDFNSMLNDVRGSFELSSTMWPNDFEHINASGRSSNSMEFRGQFLGKKEKYIKFEDVTLDTDQHTEFMKRLRWDIQPSGYSFEMPPFHLRQQLRGIKSCGG